jgi:hypothetical protein
MRISALVKIILIISAGIILLGAGPAEYSEVLVPGPTQGNHELDCTVIRPWVSSPNPRIDSYPVIVWANGWG